MSAPCRYLSGMHEYEVELKFSSALLGLPDRRTHDDVSHDDITPDKDMSHDGDSADVHELIESPSTLMATANEEAFKVRYINIIDAGSVTTLYHSECDTYYCCTCCRLWGESPLGLPGGVRPVSPLRRECLASCTQLKLGMASNYRIALYFRGTTFSQIAQNKHFRGSGIEVQITTHLH